MSGSNSFHDQPGSLPEWPASRPLSPLGLIIYQHPAGSNFEVYQLPVARLPFPKLGGVSKKVTFATTNDTVDGKATLKLAGPLLPHPVVVVTDIAPSATAAASASLARAALAAAIAADVAASELFAVLTTEDADVVVMLKSDAGSPTTAASSFTFTAVSTAHTTVTAADATSGLYITPVNGTAQAQSLTFATANTDTDAAAATAVITLRSPLLAAPIVTAPFAIARNAAAAASGTLGNAAIAAAIAANPAAAALYAAASSAAGAVCTVTALKAVGDLNKFTLTATVTSGTTGCATTVNAQANTASTAVTCPAVVAAAGVQGTVPDYLGQIAVESATTAVIATDLNLNTWKAIGLS